MAKPPGKRQRGKKKSKKDKDADRPAPGTLYTREKEAVAELSHVGEDGGEAMTEEAAEDPSWVRSAGAADSLLLSTPFGLVDPEQKAYFRDAHAQLRELERSSREREAQGNGYGGYGNEDTEEYGDELGESEHALRFDAVLDEMNGRELMLATDPDCSLVLEYVASKVGDKGLRVLLDRFAGNYAVVARHRFGSHVLQTALCQAQVLIDAEAVKPTFRATEDEDLGVLRSLQQLVIDMCKELDDSLTELLQNQFGTHIVRTLVHLLSGHRAQRLPDPTAIGVAMRSQRGSKGKGKQLARASEVQDESEVLKVPASFAAVLKRVRISALRALDATTLRGLSLDPVASPALQLFIRLEAESAAATKSDLAKASASENPTLRELLIGPLDLPEDPENPERETHVETLLRDVVGSHVLEALLSACSSALVHNFWRTYMRGRVVRFGVHPVANFIAARAVRRLGAKGDKGRNLLLGEALEEVRVDGSKLVKNEKLGLLQALIERCGAIGVLEAEAAEAVLASFGLDKNEETRNMLVVVVLSLKMRKAYRRMKGQAEPEGEDEGEEGAENDGEEKRHRKRGERKPKRPKKGNDEEDAQLSEAEATMQGSLLCQSLVRLGSPANDVVYKSLASLSEAQLLRLTRSRVASHVVLVALNSGSATYAQRRTLLGALSPHLLALADDKVASRVADAVWERADGFTKFKIASTLLPHESRLAASHYGRFFARRLHLGLLHKGSREWREWANSQPNVPLLPPLPDEEVAVRQRLEDARNRDRQALQQDREDREEADVEMGGHEGGDVSLGGTTKSNGKRARGDEGERKGGKRTKVDRELDGILSALA